MPYTRQKPNLIETRLQTPKHSTQLKTKLRRNRNELVSTTNQLKLLASDGKRYLTDVLDNDGVIALAKSFPNNKASRFIEQRSHLMWGMI